MSNKEELTLLVGMQFDEAAKLFSEETLNSMLMTYTLGGTTPKESKRHFFCKHSVCEIESHKNCKNIVICNGNKKKKRRLQNTASDFIEPNELS